MSVLDLACSSSLASLESGSDDCSKDSFSPAWTAGVARNRTASRISCDLAFCPTRAFCSSQPA